MNEQETPPREGILTRAAGARDLPDRDVLRRLFDEMPELGWSARADGCIEYYNCSWHEFIGSTPKDMQGWPGNPVQHARLQRDVLVQWKHALKTGEAFEATLQLRRQDGVVRWFLTRAKAMRDKDGRVLRWIGICTDIDAQKRAEEATARAAILGSEAKRGNA